MIHSSTSVSADSVAAHYNELDLFYREVWGDHVHHGLWVHGGESASDAVLKLSEHVIRSAGVQAGFRVCDVGCGYGATSRLMAQSYGANVTGITLSKSQFDYASAQTPRKGNPRYVLGDWMRNGFPDASFDAVIAIESLSHMTDKMKFFEEVRRVLKPGGSFAVAAWLAAEKPSRWQVRHLLAPICDEGRLPGLGSASDYLQMIHHSGLKDVVYEDFTMRVKKTWPVCIRGVLKGLLTKGRYARYLLDKSNRERIFLKTPFRIWAAYETGAMKYGIFTGTKPKLVSLMNSLPGSAGGVEG